MLLCNLNITYANQNLYYITLKKKKMRKLIVLTFLLTIFSRSISFAQTDLVINASSRNTFTLNGKWKYIIDPYETGYYDYRYQPFDKEYNPESGGFFNNQKEIKKTDRVEYDFDKSPQMNIPGDWNSQNDELKLYEGTIWFRREFDNPYQKDERVFVYFGAINYEADIYFNSHKLGKHIGGFTPICYEVTEYIKAKDNYLIVKADNTRCREGVPTVNTDWWNYGGITRDVFLFNTPESFIRDYKIQLQKGSKNQIAGYIQLDGNDLQQKVSVEIPELKIKKSFTTNETGLAEINFKAPKLELWSPENPKLYEVIVGSEKDSNNEKIAFRSIETRGTDILLNGEPLFLRGICLHEEVPQRAARAYSVEDARMLLGWVKELNCNYARLAHYPHNENMARVADEMGILLWEEIPVYWTIQWDNPATLELAKQQLRELIFRDKNRGSVIIWSVGNETPLQPARNKFMKTLVSEARKLDNTRLISAAMEIDYEDFEEKNILKITDPLGEKVDLLSFNEYLGWYVNLPDFINKVSWKFAYEKPVLISETGGGALQGYHADKYTRWSEEFQAFLYEEQLKMIDNIEALRGFTPWILCDFRSPKRQHPEYQNFWNRKGLISETGTKKKAFYILQQYYKEKAKK